MALVSLRIFHIHGLISHITKVIKQVKHVNSVLWSSNFFVAWGYKHYLIYTHRTHVKKKTHIWVWNHPATIIDLNCSSCRQWQFVDEFIWKRISCYWSMVTNCLFQSWEGRLGIEGRCNVLFRLQNIIKWCGPLLRFSI